MIHQIPPSWRPAVEPALASAEAQRLDEWLHREEQAGRAIFPPRDCRFRALQLTPLDAVRVVILGQDPYHAAGQATGLCFAVPHGQQLPPSLRNIYRELREDCGIAPPAHGDLSNWAKQGVLLLNTTLTVEEGRAGSHARKGWEAITDACIGAVAARDVPTVFILWGKHAQAKVARFPRLHSGPHRVIESAHPSPLSARRGFFGSRPFSRSNIFLRDNQRQPVDWRL